MFNNFFLLYTLGFIENLRSYLPMNILFELGLRWKEMTINVETKINNQQHCVTCKLTARYVAASRKKIKQNSIAMNAILVNIISSF